MSDDKIKVYRNLKNLEPGEKWDILVSYISLKETQTEVANRLGIKEKSIETLISKLYTKFKQARETNMLIATQNNPDLFQVMKAKHVDSEHINDVFLKRLSPDNEMTLTDSEILFCEFHIEYGDDVKAIEKSKLNIGLTGKQTNRLQYEEACLMRAFYLKRKPNVANFINVTKRDTLKKLDNGKEFLQENLITFIEQLKNSNDPRQYPSFLKALEQLGRTMGAFDDKVTVNNVDADKVLDMMLAKAKEVNEEDEDSRGNNPLLAYVDGKPVYQ